MTDETYNELLWLESLRDCIEDEEYDAALAAIDAAINLRRREGNDEQ